MKTTSPEQDPAAAVAASTTMCAQLEADPHLRRLLCGAWSGTTSASVIARPLHAAVEETTLMRPTSQSNAVSSLEARLSATTLSSAVVTVPQ